MPNEPMQVPDITLLVCTFNRCADLREMLSSALAQETSGEFTFEVVVVDNNSSDGTRQVVEEFIAGGHNNLRYLFEGRQGKSFALNTGLEAARGHIYTIGDDDFILPPDWLIKIFRAFQAHPEVSVVSGKVLPRWQAEAPTWLTPKHWSAIAMADYGEEEFYADEERQICLLAGSFRRADVLAVGGYRTGLSVSGEQIGGVEDLEILQRLWKAGYKAIYQPHIFFWHKVEPQRMTKQYHRRWHEGHGRFYAALRDEQVERSSARLFDVPLHLYRQAAADALGWLRCALQPGRAEESFAHETRLCFFRGFFRQRREDYAAVAGRGGAGRELLSFARALATGRNNGRGAPKGVG
ncbi:MAG: glycosyltransferase [Pyrinomonadaceae bacterium]